MLLFIGAQHAAGFALWEEREASIWSSCYRKLCVCAAYAKNKQVASMNGKRDQ